MTAPHFTCWLDQKRYYDSKRAAAAAQKDRTTERSDGRMSFKAWSLSRPWRVQPIEPKPKRRRR